MREALDALHKADSRVLILGRGSLGAVDLVRRFLAEEDAAGYVWGVVTSQAAMGAVPGAEMLGHTGTREANLLVTRADALLVCGARLDVRQTGSEVEEWARGKVIVRVDIDEAELKFSRIRMDYAFCQDSGEWLRQVLT